MRLGSIREDGVGRRGLVVTLEDGIRHQNIATNKRRGFILEGGTGGQHTPRLIKLSKKANSSNEDDPQGEMQVMIGRNPYQEVETRMLGAVLGQDGCRPDEEWEAKLTVAVQGGVSMLPCPFCPIEQGLPESDMAKKGCPCCDGRAAARQGQAGAAASCASVQPWNWSR